MPYKSIKPRNRYIAFKVHAPRTISRKEVITAIRRNTQDKDAWDRVRPWLTVFDNNEGILRCAHTAKDEAIELLSSIKVMGMERVPITVETLGTSGTIKNAKRRFIGKGH